MPENTDWDYLFQFIDVGREVGSDSSHDPLASPILKQEPTPPHSHENTPSIPLGDAGETHTSNSSPGDTGDVVFNVSSTFLPGANLHPLAPDLLLISIDQVFFYVHSHILLQKSINNFCSLLPLTPQHTAAATDLELFPITPSLISSSDHSPPLTGLPESAQLYPPPIQIPQILPLTPEHTAASGLSYPTDPSTSLSSIDFSGVSPGADHSHGSVGPHYPALQMRQHSPVLNVILHAIYDISCALYAPSIDTLIAAVEEMPYLGLPLQTFISPSTSLYSLLLSHAPLHALRLYALAGQYDLNDLAVPVSSHLLSYSLSDLEDDMAERIGPIYLKRLFFLHAGRTQALKRMLLQPPRPHAPTPHCDFAEQKKLTRAWALASAHLAWDARADLSTVAMEVALNPLIEHLTCKLCEKAMRDRVRDLIVQWSLVKRTI